MIKSMKLAASLGALAIAAVSLTACGGNDETAAPAAASPSSKTLAAVIADEGDLGGFEKVVGNAGLADVLEGKGPYTVFAPTEAALGSTATDLSDAAMKAQSAALLRAHIVPGALTRADIEAALARAVDNGVQMRTMADGLLTFSKEGGALVVTASDGSKARLTGDETLASNGVVQPVDAVLVKPAT